MNDDSGWLAWIIMIVVVVWLAAGGGWTTAKGWFGWDTYEDRRDALANHLKGNRIGTSGDVWLVKGNFGVPDRVALFFGYLDDWDACYEFMTMYRSRYPSDVYSCEFAN